jgi:hypothetical protein
VVTTELGLNFGYHMVSTVTGLRKIGLYQGPFLDDRLGLMDLFILKSHVTLPKI